MVLAHGLQSLAGTARALDVSWKYCPRHPSLPRANMPATSNQR